MRSSRSYERQIDKLLAIIERQNDRIMHLAGATWEPPPVDTWIGDPVEEPPEEELVPVPERYPDDHDWSAK